MIVDCDIRKWDGRPSYRFEVKHLGRDEHGTWLGAPGPTSFVGPKSAGTWNHSFVMLVPESEWWIASFNAANESQGIEIYVDITTATEWTTETTLRTIDLDLDVARLRDGRVELWDEDEFDEHRVELGYPDEIVEGARAAAWSMLAAVEARTEPFGVAGSHWLAKLA